MAVNMKTNIDFEKIYKDTLYYFNHLNKEQQIAWIGIGVGFLLLMLGLLLL